MRKLGLIGGMSWAATEEYYRLINRGLQKRVSANCSAPLLIESLNNCDLSRLTSDEQWAHAAEVLSTSARRLEAAGASAIMISANSMYRVADAVQAAISVPLINIIDETAEKLRADGIKSAAIIGTRNVMAERWYRQRLVAGGVTLAPADIAHADTIDHIIYDELMQGKVTEASRRVLRTIITDIDKQEVDAIVLACTELVMIVDADANVLPIYDTTRIHAAAGVDWILGDAP
ncbi:MAG: amino acid racemase [Sphingopyxis sp.]|nr:amino acid racemase [Sphingopyxis sp.]